MLVYTVIFLDMQVDYSFSCVFCTCNLNFLMLWLSVTDFVAMLFAGFMTKSATDSQRVNVQSQITSTEQCSDVHFEPYICNCTFLYNVMHVHYIIKVKQHWSELEFDHSVRIKSVH